MKVILLASIVIFVSLGASAQADSTRKAMNADMMKENMKTINKENVRIRKQIENSESTDVTMTNGKMMTVDGGKKRRMTQNVTMRNGTIVMPNGLIMKSDNTTGIMEEGEYIDMHGKIVYSNVFHKVVKQY